MDITSTYFALSQGWIMKLNIREKKLPKADGDREGLDRGMFYSDRVILWYVIIRCPARRVDDKVRDSTPLLPSLLCFCTARVK